ncbi:hypothetical protein BD626DRAFT_480085 [Schizophyllum amplum]|uniref:Uncharacterized protein n=1 Tax=Schizophyllum amplum TaxID=97359 RepID=A0A550CSW4_9AGAR|nr:hypothetical protein BD626DRAFT_480085 [Auriculariopsis ampla]
MLLVGHASRLTSAVDVFWRLHLSFDTRSLPSRLTRRRAGRPTSRPSPGRRHLVMVRLLCQQPGWAVYGKDPICDVRWRTALIFPPPRRMRKSLLVLIAHLSLASTPIRALAHARSPRHSFLLISRDSAQSHHRWHRMHCRLLASPEFVMCALRHVSVIGHDWIICHIFWNVLH